MYDRNVVECFLRAFSLIESWFITERTLRQVCIFRTIKCNAGIDTAGNGGMLNSCQLSKNLGHGKRRFDKGSGIDMGTPTLSSSQSWLLYIIVHCITEANVFVMCRS